MTEDERVRARMDALVKISAGTGVDFWNDPKWCLAVVRFQDHVQQTREFIECYRSMLSTIFNALFPRNPQPQRLEELLEIFQNREDIHQLIKTQLVAGARLALAWVRTHQPRIDLNTISQGFPPSNSRQGTRMTHHYEVALTLVTRMVDALLDADSEYFTEFSFANPA